MKDLKKIDKAIKKISAVDVGDNNIFDIIKRECESAGITLSFLCNELRAGLQAYKITINKFGESVKEVDFATRHKYLVTALEFLRLLKVEIKVDQNVSVDIKVDHVDIEERLRCYSQN